VSSGRFLQTFTLMLVLSLSIYPAALSERVGANDEKERSEKPDDNSSSLASINLTIPAQPMIKSSSSRLNAIDKTYIDAYTILRERNSCSRFFGGSYISTVVLNLLYPKLKKTTLDQNEIGIIMSGSTTVGKDMQTGIGFRLFDNAIINLKGPFFQNFNLKLHKFFHNIGDYPPNSREARVIMLLHEMGHLLPGSGAHWLLPDDGGNVPQVMANTATILNQCNEQVKSLSFERDSAGQ
jgi:hypothetical protein